MSIKCPTIAMISIILFLSLFTSVNDISTTAQGTNITIRASVASDGSQGNDESESPSISADGRYVAFESDASNLVDDDTNGDSDIFVYDQLTEQTVRVSVNSDGSEGNWSSQSPVISADGRYVAFVSHASNLVSNDTNGCEDIFVHDRQTGQTTRVSVTSSGSQANDRSFYPAISADGRYIAFTSHANNLVNGDTNNYSDVFVRDLQTGETARISIAMKFLLENGNSLRPSISADGRYIAFESNASTLVSGDTNGCADIFFYDQLTGQTTRISISSGGTQGNGDSRDPSISADGRYVAFWSDANNLVSDDTNGQYDAFVHDRQTGQTKRVSIASDGTQGNGGSSAVEISGSGRYVVFTSSSSNLVSGDTNGRYDVFVHDRQTGQTERVSIASDGTQGNMGSGIASISTNGSHVAFESLASNLVGNDTNSVQDIFVHGLAALNVAKEDHPDPVQAGAQLTYTLHITNTGSVDLRVTVTDTLPAHVMPTGILTWTPTITTPGGIWTTHYVVTVEMGYAGPLTNGVHVTTAEGATGIYTTTSQSQVTPALSVSKRADADLVPPGDKLTYTLAVTNTGNVTLTTTITDILPLNVTLGETSGGSIIMPPGWIIWSPVTLAPADVWTKTIVVTVTMGAAGPLTNTVQVVAEEGAWGADTVIVAVEEGITGLTARNDSPTQLGDATTLTATVTAGSNMAYFWDFGDDEIGSGAVVSHTYLNVGAYTAIVTANNSFNVMTTTSLVTITAAPIAGLTAVNDSPTPLGRPTTLTATVTAGSDVVYTWTFGDGEIGYGKIVSHHYPACGAYTAVVTASNSANSVTMTTSVKIIAYVYLPVILKP